MFKRLKDFLSLPPSRKRQYIAFQISRLKTVLIYGRRMHTCGKGTIIKSPLFMTPEFISLGTGVLIWDGCRIEGVNEHGASRFAPHIELGNGVSLQERCHIVAAGRLLIGAGTTISYDVMVTDVDHEYRDFGVNVLEQRLLCLPTAIGKACFIGAGARILAGAVLGDNCIVGANAVVRGHFPAGSVIAGVPARIIKQYDFVTATWQRTYPEKGDSIDG